MRCAPCLWCLGAALSVACATNLRERGGSSDAGAPLLDAASLDAASSIDAASPIDAALRDAAPSLDAAPSFDAAPSSDAGPPVDAPICAPESCDGDDDDCDGVVDDDCACTADAQCGRGERCFEARCAPRPTTRTVLYTDAEYEQRHNWVLRCDGDFDYAYTARGDDHRTLDCERLYAPDGTRRGRAIFRFAAVAPGRYEISIRSRHSANRNPRGAIVALDGEERRIDQTTGAELTTDVWGERVLRGDVTVVLDAREGESDSVAWVRLTPR